jgi:two-component system sensor histidine kinase UhpB
VADKGRGAPRRWWAGGPFSLLWRIFAVNVALWTTGIVLLAVTPASVHAKIRFDELIMLIVGSCALLSVDLLLLRRSLRPLRDLAGVMASVDPMHPGQRAPDPVGIGAFSSEVAVLSAAFNDMLDRLETERRDSARRTLAATEGERLRIARELHDEIGQSLTFVSLRADHALPRPDTHGNALTEISGAARATLGDVQRIARELRPEALDDLGLVDALLALCSRSASYADIRVERDLDSTLPQLGSEVELVVYRVAQEALTNAIRHSRSPNVRISLRMRQEAEGEDAPGTVVLSVRDHGDGMPAAAPEGNGIRGMRERAVLVGAELAVSEPPDGGVEVRLTIAARTRARIGT